MLPFSNLSQNISELHCQTCTISQKALKGLKVLHFLFRDRNGDETVFSLRVIAESDKINVIKSKITNKLGTLFSSNKFVVDPSSDSPLQAYVAREFEKRIAELDQKNSMNSLNS